MAFLVRGRDAENIEKKKKTDKRKASENEDKEQQRMQGKSNNNNKHSLFFTFYIKNIYISYFIRSHFICSFYELQDI